MGEAAWRGKGRQVSLKDVRKQRALLKERGRRAHEARADSSPCDEQKRLEVNGAAPVCWEPSVSRCLSKCPPCQHPQVTCLKKAKMLKGCFHLSTGCK